MLGSVLTFFQKELTDYLELIGATNNLVAFPKYGEGSRESINFQNDGLNLMIVNLEEENILRQSDMFVQKRNDISFPVFPEIRLNLYLLFVADLNNYLTSVNMLSLVIRYFQAKRIFDHTNSPGLPSELEKLTMELITQPFAQQNDIWNALRTAYKPSLLYKVRMVVFQEDEPFQKSPNIQQLNIKGDINKLM